MLNLPNLLTLFRILLVPLLVVVLLTKFEGKDFVGLGLFLLAALTDFLDGFLARRRQQITSLGKLLDPAADKILVSAAFVSLVELGVAPAWMVVVILSREFAVAALRSFAAAERLVISAGWLGKLKTVVQMVAISILIIYNRLQELGHPMPLLAPVSLWLALGITAYSGVEYYVRFAYLFWNRPADAPPSSAET